MHKTLYLTCVFTIYLSSFIGRAEDYSKESFSSRVERARRISKGIRVDGNDADWNGYPQRFGNRMLFNDPSRQLVSTRVLADEEGLKVSVRTAGVPSRENNSFGFRLDYARTQRFEVEFSNNSCSAGCTEVTYLPKDKPVQHLPLHGAEFAVGSCVEWNIPWSALAEALPSEERDALLGTQARSFVRVMPYGWNPARRAYSSFGPAVACYRTTVTEQTADKPLPPDAPEPVRMSLPMEGQCFVAGGGMQGPDGDAGHRTKWCYDLNVMDQNFFPSPLGQGHINAQHYAWNRRLYAPRAGIVVSGTDSNPDHAPMLPKVDQLPSNFVRVKFNDNTICLAHIKHASLVAHVSDHVELGAELARVGDTGPSHGPHVHMMVENPKSAVYIPIVLEDVCVSLNPGGGDYWQRNVHEWPIQEGMFIEKCLRGTGP